MASMYEEEIEFFDDMNDELNELKEANRTDEGFKEFLAKHGAKHTLYLATTLHREVADQLNLANTHGIHEENQKWRVGAVRVCGGMKKRRQQLRRLVIEVYGEEAVEEINQMVLEESEDLV